MSAHDWDVPQKYPGDFRTCGRCGVTVGTKLVGEDREYWLIGSRQDKFMVMTGRAPDTRVVSNDCDEETIRSVLES